MQYKETSRFTGKGYKHSDYTLVIAIMQRHKRIIIVQKLTLVLELWALLSPRCPPSLERTIGSVALRKGSRRFCPHCSDRCRVLMLMCWNSSLWQRCERCSNVLSSIWPAAMARSIEQRGHHVTCALIGTQPSALNDARVRVGECKPSLPRYPNGQSRTCYQECGCHLLHSW